MSLNGEIVEFPKVPTNLVQTNPWTIAIISLEMVNLPGHIHTGLECRKFSLARCAHSVFIMNSVIEHTYLRI